MSETTTNDVRRMALAAHDAQPRRFCCPGSAACHDRACATSGNVCGCAALADRLAAWAPQPTEPQRDGYCNGCGEFGPAGRPHLCHDGLCVMNNVYEPLLRAVVPPPPDTATPHGREEADVLERLANARNWSVGITFDAEEVARLSDVVCRYAPTDGPPDTAAAPTDALLKEVVADAVAWGARDCYCMVADGRRLSTCALCRLRAPDTATADAPMADEIDGILEGILHDHALDRMSDTAAVAAIRRLFASPRATAPAPTTEASDADA